MACRSNGHSRKLLLCPLNPSYLRIGKSKSRVLRKRHLTTKDLGTKRSDCYLQAALPGKIRSKVTSPDHSFWAAVWRNVVAAFACLFD
jgi:hypothetical protein